MDMIDQIGGWRSVGGIGARYGEGYTVQTICKIMTKLFKNRYNQSCVKKND